MTRVHRIAIVGGGPTGMVAAALFASQGQQVTVIAPRAKPDPRTVALMQPSLRLLEMAGLWPGALQAQSAALKHLDIIDDTGNYISAPRLTFSAHELGLEAFGWNIPLGVLLPAAEQRLQDLGVEMHSASVATVQIQANGLDLNLDTGTVVSACVALAADGADSTLRRQADITTTSWRFDQHALICNFDHSGDHQNVSTERHHVGGLCTTVPLPGQRSALVWMAKPKVIAEYQGVPDALARQIQVMTKGVLGKISNVANVKTFPMRGLTANRFARHRIFLVGEAAHAMPPIGAQGLNMSMRDVGHAFELISRTDEPGSESVMEDYHLRRVQDVLERQGAVSLVNHTLIADMLPLNLLRAGAFAAIKAFPPLRDIIIRNGLYPNAQLPDVMTFSAKSAAHKRSTELSVH